MTRRSKSTKSWTSSRKRTGLEHLQQVLIEFVALICRLVFLPLQEPFVGGTDRPVAQPLGIVTGQDELDGGEKIFDERRLLVTNALPDAVAEADGRFFKFEHGQRDAIHVEHDIGPFVVVFAAQAHLLGYIEIVVHGAGKVDQPHRFGRCARAGLEFDAETE